MAGLIILLIILVINKLLEDASMLSRQSKPKPPASERDQVHDAEKV
jgi:hypothetical protein